MDYPLTIKKMLIEIQYRLQAIKKMKSFKKI